MLRAKSLLRILFQLTLICSLFWLCNLLSTHMHWLIPGSVIGLGLLLLALLSGLLPERAVDDGARWLLSELLLFFIPPVVSIIKYWSRMRDDVLLIVLLVAAGTIMVLAGTAWVVDFTYRLEKRLHGVQENGGHHA